MRARWCFVAIVALSPAAARAQTASDGVQAIVRADYAAAVRILGPLAEDTADPDPIAQFFMASLYQAGRGVAPDLVRACGLYLRAAKALHPLQSQSLSLAEAIQRELPGHMCEVASVRGWQTPSATSFTLGPIHSVHIDRSGLVVRYQGSSKRAKLTLGGIGWVYLPIRHTQLDVTSPVATRRHFIEFFIWMPSPFQVQTDWTLCWFVYEVRGAEISEVLGPHVLATINAEPPSSPPVSDGARIAVNLSGEAEWTIQEPNARSGVIPYVGVR